MDAHSILVQWWHHCYVICHLKYWKYLWKLEDKLKHDLKIFIMSAITTDGCYSKDQDSCGTNTVDTVKDWQFYSKVLHTRTVSESLTCECLHVHQEVQGTAFNSGIKEKITDSYHWQCHEHDLDQGSSAISHATKHINAIINFGSGSQWSSCHELGVVQEEIGISSIICLLKAPYDRILHTPPKRVFGDNDFNHGSNDKASNIRIR